VIDANVLIDMGYAGGIRVLPYLGKLVLLDVVLTECAGHQKQPTLEADVLKAGIRQTPVLNGIRNEARQYKRTSLSWADTFVFCYALKHKGTVLTNEISLRKTCEAFNVPFRGTIWILEEAYKKSLVSSEEIRKWTEILLELAQERRLPVQELRRILRTVR